MATNFAVLGLAADELVSATDPATILRRAFLAKAKAAHPDKGGDAAAFRAVQTAFDALRASLGGGVAVGGAARIAPASVYEEANTTDVPGYCCEAAPTARSSCVGCKGPIGKGELRCGSLDSVSGSFARWCHLAGGCWKVPGVLQRAVGDATDAADVADALLSVDGIAIVGVGALSSEHLEALAAHVAERGYWTKARPEPTRKPLPEPTGGADKASTASTTPTALSTERVFAFPVLGVDGVAGALKGHTVVLTGVFPMIESAAVGFGKGKDTLKLAIEKYGGRVTSSVSKKTSIVVSGHLPGATKLEAAAKLSSCKVMDVDGVCALMRGASTDDVAAPAIGELSRGYGGKGKLLGQPAAAAALREALAKPVAAIAGPSETPPVVGKRVRDDGDGEAPPTKRAVTVKVKAEGAEVSVEVRVA